MWEGLVASAAAFVGTNIDDLFLLMLLFAQAGSRAGRVRVAAGQYLGLAALTAGSMLGAAGLGLAPEGLLRLLGLAPVALGLRALRKGREEEAAPAGGPGVLSVAALTIANGGDNLGVYLPLFAGFDGRRLAMAAAVFALLCGLWCLLGARLAALPRVEAAIGRWKGVLAPATLILLGLHILLF